MNNISVFFPDTFVIINKPTNGIEVNVIHMLNAALE